MHDAHFLCYKVSLRVAQTHSRHPPHSRSPHSHSPHTRSPHPPPSSLRVSTKTVSFFQKCPKLEQF